MPGSCSGVVFSMSDGWNFGEEAWGAIASFGLSPRDCMHRINSVFILLVILFFTAEFQSVGLNWLIGS